MGRYIALVLHVFPSFSLDSVLSLEWETLYYWHRRAIEIKYGKEVPEETSGKIDSESFEIQKERLNKRLKDIEKSKQGTIGV